MRATLPAIASERATAGMALGVVAWLFFSLHDASIKWLVASLPVWQVLFFRSAAITAGCLVTGGRPLLRRLMATPLKKELAFRGVVNLTAWLLYYSAARTLPLAQLLTLYFAAPILTTILARPLLGERVTRWRWISVGLGFAGVLIACNPGQVAFSAATGLVLAAAALWGYGVILMRQIARRESSLLQMLCSNSVFMIGSGLGCLIEFTPPTWSQLGLLSAVGLLGGCGQFCLFEGARHAPASVMATVEYSALLWAFILGFVIWGDIPSAGVFAGAGLIVSAGALLVFRERRTALA
jgi:drug/metabolite transporter (DMT)-like permease